MDAAMLNPSIMKPARMGPSTLTPFQTILSMATAAFASLPGAPAPDYIIEDGFLPTNGDTLEYWSYIQATWTYGPTQMPLDGVRSLNADHTTGANSPTNYAGDTGSIDVTPIPAASTWGLVTLVLAVLAAGTMALRARRETEHAA